MALIAMAVFSGVTKGYDDLADSCLSGCFSKPPAVVYRNASTAVSKNFA